MAVRLVLLAGIGSSAGGIILTHGTGAAGFDVAGVDGCDGETKEDMICRNELRDDLFLKLREYPEDDLL